METRSIQYNGIGPLSLLGVVFVTLKLTDVIDWSWWWVLLPFYIGWLIILAILVVWGLLAGIVALMDNHDRKKRRKAALARKQGLARKERKTL
jgi:uncharacterized protein HemY